MQLKSFRSLLIEPLILGLKLKGNSELFIRPGKSDVPNKAGMTHEGAAKALCTATDGFFLSFPFVFPSTTTTYDFDVAGGGERRFSL
jgi:hypothetical protein